MIQDKTKHEAAQLEQSAKIELWDLDLRPFGGKMWHFCNQLNELGNEVVWRGQAYTHCPISGSGFRTSSEGAAARPSIQLSNMSGLITAAKTMLLGAKVCRRIVFARFLDAVNFAHGNPDADPEQELQQWYVIERLASLSADTASLELAIPSEMDGSVIPRRVIFADVCTWGYRSQNCGYTGGAVADEFDRPTTDLNRDQCSCTLAGCRLRFGANPLPFAGFPSVDRVK